MCTCSSILGHPWLARGVVLPDAGHLAGDLTVLDTATFQAVQQYTFGGALVAAGFTAPGGSALVVLRGLTAGLRLELFAAPARDLPLSMQASTARRSWVGVGLELQGLPRLMGSRALLNCAYARAMPPRSRVQMWQGCVFALCPRPSL